MNWKAILKFYLKLVVGSCGIALCGLIVYLAVISAPLISILILILGVPAVTCLLICCGGWLIGE